MNSCTMLNKALFQHKKYHRLNVIERKKEMHFQHETHSILKKNYQKKIFIKIRIKIASTTSIPYLTVENIFHAIFIIKNFFEGILKLFSKFQIIPHTH